MTFAALCVGVVLGVLQIATLMHGVGDDIVSWVHTENVAICSLAPNSEETLSAIELLRSEQSIVDVLKESGEMEQDALLEKAVSKRIAIQNLVEGGLVKRTHRGEEGKVRKVIVSIIVMMCPFMFIAMGIWISFRVVNVHACADFLIAVEAEMKKVSWPDSSTLTRSTIVVLVTIFFLAAVLSLFDLFWQFIFSTFGIL